MTGPINSKTKTLITITICMSQPVKALPNFMFHLNDQSLKEKRKTPRDRIILMRRRTKINKQLQKHQPPLKRQQLIRELVDIELKF